jgi:spore coat protein CotH
MRFSPLSLLIPFALAPAPLQARDPVFHPQALHETRLYLHPQDWRTLQANYLGNQYYAADVVFDGRILERVGIRSRGEGSRDPEKPALRIDFDRFVPGQRMRELRSVSLKNLVQDPSMLRERLSMAVFEAMGIAAPAVAFTVLYVNDEYWGVYNLVENVDRPFLDLRLGEDEGALYSYQWSTAPPYGLSWKGEAPAAYIPAPFTPETTLDAEGGAALVAFVRAVNETPEASFPAEMSRWLDVDRFLTYVAVENALAERDGFVGTEGMNNFYLYQYAGRRRFVLVPWDKNTSLHDAGWPFDFGLGSNVLTGRLMQHRGPQATYVAALRRAVTSFVNERWLMPILESSYALIREAALADPRKPYSSSEFEEGVQGLRGVIAAREANVLAQLGRLDTFPRSQAP